MTGLKTWINELVEHLGDIDRAAIEANRVKVENARENELRRQIVENIYEYCTA